MFSGVQMSHSSGAEVDTAEAPARMAAMTSALSRSRPPAITGTRVRVLISVMTRGMMVRPALGHTGRPLYPAPRLMTTAFVLMLAAAAVRALAAWMMWVHPTAYLHSLRLSAVLFTASLLLYAFRYLPWLLSPRSDGKAG